jgi:hypothetical protein
MGHLISASFSSNHFFVPPRHTPPACVFKWGNFPSLLFLLCCVRSPPRKFLVLRFLSEVRNVERQNVERQNVERQNVERQNVERQNVEVSNCRFENLESLPR